MLNLFQELVAALENRQPVALATIIETKGGAPGRAGFKLLMRADGTWLGNLGGGELEARVKQAAREAVADGQPLSMPRADAAQPWPEGSLL